MLKKILCNYEFIYNGHSFKSFGTYLGDTNNPKVAKQKDYSGDIICLALKISNEALAKMLNTKYWDINQSKIEAAGIHFRTLEIYFYPDK